VEAVTTLGGFRAAHAAAAAPDITARNVRGSKVQSRTANSRRSATGMDVESIGYAAGILTTASFAPQALKTIRTKDTSGISLGMYVLFVAGTGLWLAYGVVNDSLPIVLANGVTMSLAAVILGLKLRHG
jgi:MtN3 and saliva related transmembrane protein